jgi:hypothetical protein
MGSAEQSALFIISVIMALFMESVLKDIFFLFFSTMFSSRELLNRYKLSNHFYCKTKIIKEGLSDRSK